MSTPTPHDHHDDDVDDLDALILDPEDPSIDDLIIELYEERRAS